MPKRFYLRVWNSDSTVTGLRFDSEGERRIFMSKVISDDRQMHLVTSENGHTFYIRPSSAIRMEKP